MDNNGCLKCRRVNCKHIAKDCTSTQPVKLTVPNDYTPSIKKAQQVSTTNDTEDTDSDEDSDDGNTVNAIINAAQEHPTFVVTANIGKNPVEVVISTTAFQ